MSAIQRGLCAAGLLVGTLAVSLPARAGGRVLEAEPLAGVKLNIDGLPREWPGKLSDFGERVSGSPAGGDPRAAGQLGYDERSLYVALKVFDANLVRTSSFSQGEDHATLLLAFPNGRGGYSQYQVDLFPGVPGKSAGGVRMGGANVAGSKLVEAPMKGGVTLEAQIPWSAFPPAARVRVGMRAALRYTDADAPGSVTAVIGTSSSSQAAALPAFPLESEQALDQTLLKQKGLANSADKELYGNVAGDGMLERVAIYGQNLTIVGPHYRRGKQFYFNDLGVKNASKITRFELHDADGDGRQELVVSKRFGVSNGEREQIGVYRIGKNDAPEPVFSHEVAIITSAGRVENAVKVFRRGKALAIEIAQGKAEGFDPGSYSEPTPSDMPSALLPWESVKSRTFAWDGKAFSKVDEKRQAPGKAPGAAKPAGPPPPPPPRPPSADELLDRVYALYRKERKVGADKPRFDFVTDVTGDRTTERVLVHGKDIVVFGKGFRGGTSYTFISMGVADPKDVVDVTARDLTGDGKAEVIVRAVLHAKASEELGGGVVDRYALFIYKITDQVKRIFAAETGRALGAERILGGVVFKPAARGVSIELRPGRALGWTEKSYPFPTDTTAAGGLEPLLLPWAGAGGRGYVWNGSSFAGN